MKSKAYKYRIYPTKNQRDLLERTFGCCRLVYNNALYSRKTSYETEKKSINFYDTCKNLTLLKTKEEYSFLNDVSSVCLQQSLRRLQVAYNNFFKKRSRYPKYKKKSHAQSVTLTKSNFRLKGKQLFIAKCKTPVDIKWSREFNTKPTSATITKEPTGKYFISFTVKEDIKPLNKLKTKIGLDLGLTDFITTSNGTKIKAPDYKNLQRKLSHEQKRLSRKKKGSANRNKQRMKVALVHEKIKNIRNDFSHKLSTKLVHENQMICVENLDVQKMMKNKHLARSISNAGWYQFLSFLKYKCEWYGRDFVQLDKFQPTTKTCSDCGHINDKIPLHKRKWICPECEKQHDRDVNAAMNILAVGQTVSAFGESISHKANSGLVQSSLN